MQFDERLKYLRTEMGLSEKGLAEELETTETCIRLYEKRKLDVNMEMLEKMATFFGVSTKLMLGTVFENLSPEEAVKSYRLVQELEETRREDKAKMAPPPIQPDAKPETLTPPSSAPVKQPATAGAFDTLYANAVAVYSRISGVNPADWASSVEAYWPVNLAITNIYGNDLSNYFYLRVQGDHMQPTLNPGEVTLIKKQSMLQNNEVGIVLCDWGEAIVARITHSVDKVVLYFDNQTYPAQVYEASQCRVLGKVLWKTTRPPV